MQDVLVLDKFWMPQSFCSWEDAISLIWKNRAIVVKEDEAGNVLNSPSLTMNMPRIIAVKNSWTKKKRLAVPCSRRNILVRDNATCQYCSKVVSLSEFTLDHVVPRCQGGITEWMNIVVACQKCNKRKGGKTPEQCGMRLIQPPTIPKPNDPKYNFKLRVKNIRPEWKDFENYIYAEKASWSYYNIELQP